MASHEHAHPTGYKQYFMTWLWLLLMTAAALIIGYFHFLPEGIKAFLLVSITLAKIFLIGSIFMHLKAERVNLVMLTFSPLILSIVLFFFTYYLNPRRCCGTAVRCRYTGTALLL